MSVAFHYYIGIDYSGAKTPTFSLKGLRVTKLPVQTLRRRLPRRPARAGTGPAGILLS